MSSGIKLIVGLANPGSEYARTRHNAGEWFVNELIEKIHINLRVDKKFHGMVGKSDAGTLIKLHHPTIQTDIDPHAPIHFLIPTTYMNLSGQAVRALASYLKITPPEILVVHDEVDLPAGTIKLKYDGGNGGHNGLKDIISHLNTKQFHRLRIGVGRPHPGQDTADYVLGKPSKPDKALIDLAISQSMETLPLMLEGEFQKAMHQLHTQEQ
tara:strand:+ start:958 stop:1590 length:633 start_codon:yes stop_codon:yes gene_type:complete